jgi:triosephosphate isomerase
MRPLLIAGNWKMNKDLAETQAFAQGLRDYALRHSEDKVRIAVAPAYPFLYKAQELLRDTCVKVAAQDVSANEDGAFTGEVSASMLASLHLPYCLAGHSERRQYHRETDSLVNTKLKKLLQHGIIPIFCLGEMLGEREAEQTEAVLERQLSGGLSDITLYTGREVVIAYEPVWAIGTGKVATPQQAQAAHAFIRSWLKQNYSETVAAKLLILYGGSVKPDNIRELMLQPDIDGALIGGASLKLEQFLAMLDTATEVVKEKQSL